MQGVVSYDLSDCWEAWIDMDGTIGNNMLYVVGDVCVNGTKSQPVLRKKLMPGAVQSHLILELLPGQGGQRGRVAEVSYGEPVTNFNQYSQVWICAGEDIVARIKTIEVVV